MELKLSFMGAAQNVTGSRYLLEVNGTRLLIDCGLYQERDLRARNWDPFFIPPESIDAVLLTHAHLDHCGLLPKLVREGFEGSIHCTAATSEIARIILLILGGGAVFSDQPGFDLVIIGLVLFFFGFIFWNRWRSKKNRSTRFSKFRNRSKMDDQEPQEEDDRWEGRFDE